MVRVFAAHLQRAVFEGLHHIVLGVHARGCGVFHHLEGVGLQLRRAGQPAHALGAHVVVDQAATVLTLVGQRREDFFHAQLLIAPLVGVGVEEAGAIHLPGRAHPVQGEGQRGPAGLRTQLFLSHIVGPAAAALADTAAHHQHVDDAAVVHVAVVPVVHGRTDDDHGLAFGLVGVVGKLACHGNDLVALDAGDLLLPGRGVGHVVIKTEGGAGDTAGPPQGVASPLGGQRGRANALRGGTIFAGDATGHAVVGHRQIEHGGD